MIHFVCVGCHKELQIGEEWAGKLGHCPLCGTNSPVPGGPKRTSKITILARMVAYPAVVVGFFGLLMGSLPLVIGGAIAVGGALFCCWFLTNLIMWICNPREMKLWKKGGGDPWFDTLPPPFNTDPDSTKFAELYRERLRLEEEEGINFD